MSERDKITHFPDRAAIELKYVALLEGRISRDEAHDWAINIWQKDLEIRVTDWPAWKAVGLLTGTDAISTDRPYLYDEEDFRGWLSELRSAPNPK